MGRIRSSDEPDLFSATIAHETASAFTAASPPLNVVAAAAPTAPTLPLVLPTDLEKAVSQLRDEEFDRLLDAVRTEGKRQFEALNTRIGNQLRGSVKKDIVRHQFGSFFSGITPSTHPLPTLSEHPLG